MATQLTNSKYGDLITSWVEVETINGRTITDSVVSQHGNSIVVKGTDGKFYADAEFLTGIVNVAKFGVDRTGATDATSAINRALDFASWWYGGNDSVTAGYVGYFKPELVFPTGTYKTGTITVPSRINIKARGQVVFVSATGTREAPAGYFVNNAVTDFKVEGATFLYYADVFRVPTGNADFSFLTFLDCNVSECGTFIDTVSFALSRSTHIVIERCKSNYGVQKFCNIYCDKATFRDNWFYQNSSGHLLYVNSLAAFYSNMWVPISGSANRCWIEFEATDATRNISFHGDRFSGEPGSMPVVLVGDVNMSGDSYAYRNIGISFKDCFINSNATYNPSGVTAVRGAVILKEPSASGRAIDYVSFENTTITPDVTAVSSYNASGLIAKLGPDFTINFDHASAASATRSPSGGLASVDLMPYVTSPLLKRSNRGITRDNKLTVASNTATSGVKKVSFQLCMAADNNAMPYLSQAPQTYMVCLMGAGSDPYPGGSDYYAYSSVYLLEITGGNWTTEKARITMTKLAGTSGGVDGGSNANIVSAHWGTGETGSADFTFSGTPDRVLKNVTITFGAGMVRGWALIKPLWDFDMRF